MRINVIRFTTSGFDKGFDLCAPFRFDLGHVKFGNIRDERIVFEMVSICVYDGLNRFARQYGLAHCQNKVDSHPKLGCFLYRDGNIMGGCWNVHHASGGCDHALQMRFADAA